MRRFVCLVSERRNHSRNLGFVGADLANIVNEAALPASRQDKEFIEAADFDEAIERVVAGLQKNSQAAGDVFARP